MREKFAKAVGWPLPAHKGGPKGDRVKGKKASADNDFVRTQQAQHVAGLFIQKLQVKIGV